MLRLNVFLLILLTIFINTAGLYSENNNSDLNEFEPDDTKSSQRIYTNNYQEDTFPLAQNIYLSGITTRSALLNAYSGKVIVLEFWTTWDRLCNQEVSQLNGLYRKYQKKGLEVLGVCLEQKEQTQDLTTYSSKINYPLFLCSEDISAIYSIWGLPTIYIIDKNFRIYRKFSGYVTKGTIEKIIKKLL